MRGMMCNFYQILTPSPSPPPQTSENNKTTKTYTHDSCPSVLRYMIVDCSVVVIPEYGWWVVKTAV